MSSLYNKEPVISIHNRDNEAWRGYASIVEKLKNCIGSQRKTVVTIECYPTVREQEIIEGLSSFLQPTLVIRSEAAAKGSKKIDSMLERYLTDDRVFGYMAPHQMEEFFIKEKLDLLLQQVEALNEGLVLIIGVGASLITKGDILIYADLARWEIQLRYRTKEFGNWLADNLEEDILRKYKRSYFVEWRVADRMKRSIFHDIDFYLDTNTKDDPKMVTKAALLDGLQQTVSRPFRLVPYFDPGVWGGRWLKENMGLEEKANPYAWGFDGVPEENSLYLQFKEVRLEVPSINLVFFEPKRLLGEAVYARFGAEFPIRFDFLDTIGGQSLSLQVHPTTDYIRSTFGMHYTQDESYYILDAEPGATVYLGVEDGINPEELMADLERAQEGGFSFPAEQYINVFPAKKHDYFLIPAGTVHCSGSNSMVLEISATPYIFTFKLWDWDRLGLDGKPRPVHLEHGRRNIQWDRRTEWVQNELINRNVTVDSGDGWLEERTGLHELEFIETRRHWFTSLVPHHTNGIVHILNLVEGEEAVVESPSGAFEPFTIHYAETFIVPAAVGAYTIRPGTRSIGKQLATIKAFVR